MVLIMAIKIKKDKFMKKKMNSEKENKIKIKDKKNSNIEILKKKNDLIKDVSKLTLTKSYVKSLIKECLNEQVFFHDDERKLYITVTNLLKKMGYAKRGFATRDMTGKINEEWENPKYMVQIIVAFKKKKDNTF